MHVPEQTFMLVHPAFIGDWVTIARCKEYAAAGNVLERCWNYDWFFTSGPLQQMIQLIAKLNADPDHASITLAAWRVAHR